jgi:hypothetical protein
LIRIDVLFWNPYSVPIHMLFVESKHSEEPRESKAIAAVSPAKEGVIRTTGGLTREEPEGGGVKPELLHSGPLLGESPVSMHTHGGPRHILN